MSSFATDREQAKSLLLKGCYRMAANRYTSLLTQPPQLQPRQLSILHLNLGICNQFQDKLADALTSINRAIEIDPTYEKAHFRKVQVLMAMERWEEASELKPINKEIAGLVEEARGKYVGELVGREWGQIEVRLTGAMEVGRWALLDEVNHKLYGKYSEIQEDKFQQELENGVFRKYVLFLLKQSERQNTILAISKFCELMYKLFVTRKQNQSVQTCLPLWQDIAQLQTLSTLIPLDLPTLKLLSFCPIILLKSQRSLVFLIHNLQKLLKDKATADSLLVCVSYNLRILKIVKSEVSNVNLWRELSNKIGDGLEESLAGEQGMSTNLELVESIESCASGMLKIIGKGKQMEKSGFRRLLSLRDELRSSKQGQIQEASSVNIEFFDRLLETVISNQLTFANLTIINSIVDRVSNLKSVKQCELYPKVIALLANSLNTILNICPRYLLLACLLTKLTFPQPQTLKLSSLTSYLPANPQTAYRQLELFCILNLTSKQVLIKLLQTKDITFKLIETVMGFIKSDDRSMETVKLRLKVIQFLYFLFVDGEEETEKRYAEKMGVQMEKIKAARMMQGEVKKEEAEKIGRLRGVFIAGGECVITSLEGLASQYERSPPDNNSRLKSIIISLAKQFPLRFYASPFLDLIVNTHQSQTDKLCKDQTYVFLSTILKRCSNPQLLLYRHQHPIILLLLESLQNASHQLIIFESLLSLVHLSTLPWSDTTINIRPVCKLLFEENEYILHGVLEVMNNFLLKGKAYYDQIGQKDWEIVGAMLMCYREIVQKNQETEKPKGDYSNPHKLYVTLVSLMMVAQDYQKVEVRELRDLEFVVSQLLKMNEAQKLQMVIKVVHYYHIKGTLKKRVVVDSCKEELQAIKRTIPDKYASLAKILGLP